MKRREVGKRLLTLKVLKESKRDIYYVLITKEIIRRLGLDDGLYCIRLMGVPDSELYIYIDTSKKNKLVTNRLDPKRTYLASIENITLKDVVDTINSRIKKYGRFKLSLDSDKLYIIFPDKSSVEVTDYILEKPFGGKLGLKIILRKGRDKAVKLKFTLIDGRLGINIITGYTPGKGRDLRAVEEIWLEKNLVITYRKGEKDTRNLRIPL